MQIQNILFDKANWYNLPTKKDSPVSKIGIVQVGDRYIRCYEDSTGYRWFNNLDIRQFGGVDFRSSPKPNEYSDTYRFLS